MSDAFNKNHKLTKQYQFDSCIKQGKRFKIYPFICFVSVNNSGVNRLGLLVSKRWQKLAVKRNLLKRRLRETFRLLDNKSKLDIVIIPFKEKNITYEQVNNLWNILNLS
mgnify:CR=1 FL=1